MVQLQWLQYKHHNQVLRSTESRVDSDDKNLVDNYKRLPTGALVDTLLISSVRLQLRGLRTTSAPHLGMEKYLNSQDFAASGHFVSHIDDDHKIMAKTDNKCKIAAILEFVNLLSIC